MGGVAAHLQDSATAFGQSSRNANLRRLQLAWAASIIGHWAFLVAVSVYAYGVGGETARRPPRPAPLVPAALVAPFAACSPTATHASGSCSSPTSPASCSCAQPRLRLRSTQSPGSCTRSSIAATIANTPFRPAQAALTPSLARTPDELTAANAVASTHREHRVFAGPALAGLLLAVPSIGSSSSSLPRFVVSAVFVLRIRVDASRHRAASSSVDDRRREARRLPTLARDPALRVLVGLFTAQTRRSAPFRSSSW